MDRDSLLRDQQEEMQLHGLIRTEGTKILLHVLNQNGHKISQAPDQRFFYKRKTHRDGNRRQARPRHAQDDL